MSLLDIHLYTLIAVAIVIIYSDHRGFAYFRGKVELLGEKETKIIHYLVWAGFIGMIVSGGLMFKDSTAYYLMNPAFFVKMFFVLLLVINGVVIGKLATIASKQPFASLSASQKKKLLISGAISTICWIGAATIGFFFLGV